MHQTSNRVINTLGYAGLIPFIAGVLLYAFNINVLPTGVFGAFMSYSLVILFFMAGAVWGKMLNSLPEAPALTFIVTNAVPMLAWLMLIFDASNTAVVIVQMLGFIAIFFTEYPHGRPASVRGYCYYTLRWRLTAVVVLCHLGMLLL